MAGPTLATFQRGEYQKIHKYKFRSLASSEARVAYICAKAFLGELDEAVGLLKGLSEKLSSYEKALLNFVLGVSFTRVGKIDKGAAFFKANLKEQSKETSAITHQGIGFHFFFLGRFDRSVVHAKKAFAASTQANDMYFQFLSKDLLGHCRVLLGKRSQGIRLIKSSAGLAREFGNLNFGEAFEVSAFLYEAEGGQRYDSILRELNERIKSLSVQDIYTRNNLILELARQLTLRGQYSSASQLLDQEAQKIYSYSNARQEILLQVRLAEIALRRGQLNMAEHFVQLARRCAKDLVDKTAILKALGIQMKLQRMQGREVDKEILEKVKLLTEQCPSQINLQMLSRSFPENFRSEFSSEDSVAELFQLKEQDLEAALQLCLNKGYLALWSEFKKIPYGTQGLYIMEDGKSFVGISNDRSLHKSSALSSMQVRLLRALAKGNGSKGQLVDKVWGYTYRPLDHDQMVYAAITKLRQTLNPFGEWIETTSEGWKLRDSVKWEIGAAAARVARSESVADDKEIIPVELLLTTRQELAISELNKRKFWTIRDFKRHFKVSTMTAYRDLDTLREHKLLVRQGSGRSTLYVLKRG